MARLIKHRTSSIVLAATKMMTKQLRSPVCTVCDIHCASLLTTHEDVQGEMAYFYDKVRDLFVDDDPLLAPSSSDEQPNDGPSGNPDRPDGKRMTFTKAVIQADQEVVTATSYFDPAQPSDLCFAWSSLDRYCGTAGTPCLCYSSTYYVPDVWNKLASGCANMMTECSTSGNTAATWCSVGRQASNYSTWCATAPSDESLTSVGFAQITGTDQATAPATPSPAQQISDSGAVATSTNEIAMPAATTSTSDSSPTAPAGTNSEVTSDASRIRMSCTAILGLLSGVSLASIVWLF